MTMTYFIIYMLKVAVFIASFYILYQILLSGDKSFSRNRFYLLISLLISFLLPLIPISGGMVDPFINLGEIIVKPGISPFRNQNDNPILLLIAAGYAPVVVIYATGFILASLLLLVRLISLFRHISQSTRTDKGLYILNKKSVSSFSAFGKIFISSCDATDYNLILIHEESHNRHLHFADLLIIEIVSLLQWFNPFIYMMNRSVRMVHEYQADDDCISNGIDLAHYGETLLLKTFSSRRLVPASAFSQYSLLKNRFKMMKNSQPSKLASLKVILALPLTFGVFILLSSMGLFPEPVVTDFKAVEMAKPINIQSSAPDSVYIVPEVMPTFMDGDITKFRTWVMSNVKYPAEAVKAGIQGKVFVQFVVNTEGKIINAEILKSVNPLLDEEALRAILSAPDWVPGKNKGEAVNVRFAVAINFALN